MDDLDAPDRQTLADDGTNWTLAGDAGANRWKKTGRDLFLLLYIFLCETSGRNIEAKV